MPKPPTGGTLASTPQPAAADAAAPQLPAPLTRFVGRERELDAVRELLDEHRLVTLTGAAGSGKTRLALEAARRLRERLPDVRWMELAPLSDPAFLEPGLREAVGATRVLGLPDRAALEYVLRGRRTLVVLDNCEHLVEACALLVDHLLRACPELSVLATSRRPLGVDGEVTWNVPGLSVPDAEALGPEELLASEAVRLFELRAGAVLPGFTVTAANAEAVAAICRRLDGVPLAVEFAAARLHALTPSEIETRLHDRFHLLTSGSRTALPRHRTLRAAVDWSYGLLTEPERLLLDRLAVFAGAFSLDAAEAVCGFGSLHRRDVMDLVSRLVEASLLDLVERDGDARYRLQETMRQYAAERLAERGEREEMARRHFAYFAGLVERVEPDLIRRTWPEAVARLNRDFDNLHDALLWSRAADPAAHLGTVGRLTWFWLSTGRWNEGSRWVEEALADPGEAAAADRARGLFTAGLLSTILARPAGGRPWLQEALVLVEELGDERLEAYVRNYLGFGLIQEGNKEGRRHLLRAAELFERHGDLFGVRLAYMNLGFHALHTGAIAESITLAERAVAAARALGGERELGVALQCLGLSLAAGGEAERALGTLRDSVRALAVDGNVLFLARSCEALGTALTARGEPSAAATLFGAAAGLRATIGTTGFRLDAERAATAAASARAILGQAAYAEAHRRGQDMDVDEAVAFALEVTGSNGAPEAPAEPAAPPLEIHIRALGPLDISVLGGGAGPGAWRYAKARELLVLLACRPKGCTREEVGDALWAGATPARVKNNFHVTLHRLRRAVGHQECVQARGTRYRLASGVSTVLDALAFQRRVTELLAVRDTGPAWADELSIALAGYRGHFMEGEDAGDWHLELRDALRLLWLEGMVRLAETRALEGRFAEAAQLFERVVAEDDLHEGAHRGIMTAYAGMGEPQRSRRHYELLELRRRRDLSEQLEPATQALYRELALDTVDVATQLDADGAPPRAPRARRSRLG